jgi:hypothetical protein
MHGNLSKKRLLILIALIMAICIKWYITDIYLFTVASVTLLFCLLVQIPDSTVSMLHSRPITFETLSDDKKPLYLIFVRLSVAVSLVVVIDYAVLNYEKQDIYSTLGIIGGLITLINKIEQRMAKFFLLLTHYIINYKQPYKKQNDGNAENGTGTIMTHKITT